MSNEKRVEILGELLGESVDIVLDIVKQRYFEHLLKSEMEDNLSGIGQFTGNPFRMLRIAFDEIEKEYEDEK